jgi:adenylate cyclase
MKNRVKYIILYILTSLIFLTFYTKNLEPLHSFSLHFNDLNFVLQDKKASQEIVFIAVDEESVNTFGRWPWNRDILAHAIDKLDSSNILIFDMVFSESTSHDILFTQSIENHDNTICGFFLRHKASRDLSDEQKDILSDSSLERLASEIGNKKFFIEGNEAEVNTESILSSCTLSATFSILRDSDQLLRNYPLAFSFNDELYPTLGSQALRMKLNQDLLHVKNNLFSVGEHFIPTNKRGFSMLNYYPLKSYKMYSFLDLYQGKLTQDILNNKIVILGITEIGVGDLKITPIGLMPGPLVHYTFISNVLKDELLHENSILTIISLLFFLLLSLSWIFIHSIYKRVLLYTSSYILFFMATKIGYLYFNLYLDAFYPLIALVFTAITSESILYQEQEEKSRFIGNAFSSYLSPILLKKLMQEPERLKLGGEKKELTIFFSDIRSFTSISEKMQPEDLTQYLNRYFTPMSDIVTAHHGMIDKYIGDALMAFYNAPLDIENHAIAACDSALEMMETLARLNKEFKKEGFSEINIGIGLNTAKVVVGNMGSDKRFNYTVIGDGVNLASRVEGLNKEFKTNIIITEFTKAQIGDTFLTRALDRVQVKGKEEKVMLFELLKDTPKNRKKVEIFHHVLSLYNNKNFKEALIRFTELKKDDIVCEYFIKKLS